ncbi:LytS/YhcK type 5TM receptor domain-containing protein [Oceanobacillus halophilus]|uniref:histidine kinase n=1 Tax=Oceanobacillus halophilus TaxID=930130 RepID=A0A495AB11_9BACI|nr:LytS/YhcK type 5TM receptor domain-containing protein [Oceanobacillus halophilus]RKQ37271.1 sensor histidine kinase [Oceanobacillus halophilus]
MVELTIILFQRIGLLLLIVFMLTRIPGFRSLLDRDITIETVIYHALVFGVIGILATHTGVVIKGEELMMQSVIADVDNDEVLIGFSLVVVMIAGLLGGPYVGLGAGIVSGIYIALLGGEAWFANSLINPLAGLITGWTGQFFSEERVIAPNKALFIGIFPPVFHMGLLLIFLPNQEIGIELVNMIGIPLVVTNSVALAIFTMMIRVAFNESEREAALETNRALSIAEKALPLLRDAPLAVNAKKMAELFYEELEVAAIAVTDKDKVLAHVGLGGEHHQVGEPLKMRLSRKALEDGEIQVAYEKTDLQCRFADCPLKTAIMVPVYQSGDVIGLLNIYFRHSQQIRAVEVALAKGLGTLISNQLSGLEAERMKELLKEAEMRNLQAQINPHFLFNTFNLIHSLMRVDSEKARYILVQLSQYMRANLKITSEPLIHLQDELRHLYAYLEIVKARFPDHIMVEVDISEGLEHVLIPPATLQPLVENSVQHGLGNNHKGGIVQINIIKNNDLVYIEVKDNGQGFPKEFISTIGEKPLNLKTGNGTALYNINQRLKGLLGEKSALQFINTAKGSIVSFQLPLTHRLIEENNRYKESTR